MSRAITVEQTADRLRAADDIRILLHQFPDGDTIGSGYALARALRALGKRVRVDCCDAIPAKYAYITDGMTHPDFAPQFICAVDVADPRLLGSLRAEGERAHLCIDHHATNVQYADELLLDASCGAAAMVVRRVIAALGVSLDRAMADALYTGLSTDTGCFKYENTTPAAHRLAAELMECGADYAHINEAMFERRSRARMELERLALEGMRYPFDGRCAVMTITRAMIAAAGAGEDDMEGLAPIPRQIEGVWVGVTLRERRDGSGYKVSLRTGEQADASAIAARLGGGGHRRAAGCSVDGDADTAIAAVLDAVRTVVPKIV